MFPVDKVGDVKIDTSDERKALDTFDDKDDKTKDKSSEKDNEEVKEEEDKEEEGKEEEGEEHLDEGEEGKEDDDKEKEEEEEKDEYSEALEEDTLYQQIKKSYPKILKEIPGLRAAIFRDQQYGEIYPTIDEAKEAKSAAETFQSFQQDIESGNPANLLKAVEHVGKDTLRGFVANFFPTLEKQDKALYAEALYPEFKKLFRYALKDNREVIQNSARNLNFLLFGDTDVEKDEGLVPTKRDEKEDKISQREKEFEERQYKTFAADVFQVGTARTKKFISKAFENSDISDWQKKKLVDDIFDRVEASVKKDPRHMGNMGQLWKKAQQAGWTSDYKDRIISAYLSRAKLIIPQVRQKVLSEAKVKVTVSEEKKSVTRIPSTNVAGSGQGYKPGQKIEVDKIDWSKTDERAMLDGKVVYKK